MPVQQQRGEYDCGLFVIATALHITAGNNIEEVSFDQTRMRSHLVQCFEMKVLSPFPQPKKKVKRSMLANILIPFFCHCGRPDSLDEMIQCDACDVWFHFQCAHIGFVPLVLRRPAVIVRHHYYTLACFFNIFHILQHGKQQCHMETV